MRPIYVVVVAAVLGVGALLYFLMESGPDRRGGRGQTISGSAGDGSREGDSAGEAESVLEQRGRERGENEYALTIVVRGGGKAAEGATVVLTGPRVWRGATDVEGRAYAPWLVPGKYAVVASQGAQATAQTIELSDGDREIELALADGIPIRGTIRAANGIPISGARVHAEPTSEQTSAAPGWRLSWLAVSAHPAIYAETRSDAEGKYELILPTAASYMLRVNAREFGGVTEPAREYTEAVEGLDFYMQPGSPIAGQVVDVEDKPIAGALVVVTSSARGNSHPAIAVTDSEGAFALHATLGTFSHMMVRARGYATTTAGIVRPPALAMRIILERGATYRVRFVTKGTQEPIEGVEANVQTGGGGTVATSGPDGVALFENVAVARGAYGSSWRNLTAACKGYIPMTKNLGQGQPVDGVIDAGDIELERGATILGRVTDEATGEAIAGAKVRAFSMTTMRFSRSPMSAVESGPDGRYELTGTPPDTVAIVAEHQQYTSSQDRQQLYALARDKKNYLLAPGQLRLERNVQLVPAAGVSGVVLGPDGEPLPGALVTGPWRGGWTGGASAMTDAEGKFEIPGYAKGRRVQLRATHREYGGAATQVLKAGEGETATLQLARAVTVTGRVVGPDGNPVHGVNVTLAPVVKPGTRRARRFGALSGTTNAEGVFVIRNGVAGESTLRFDESHHRLRTKTVDIPDSDQPFDAGMTKLERGLGLAGRVVDDAGRGVPGVSVSASWFREGGSGMPVPTPPGSAPPDERTNATVTTDQEGRFSMWGFKDGSYRITVLAAGRYASSPTVQTGNLEIRVVVKDPAVIHGRVVSGGQPVKGAWVQATQPGNNPNQPRWLCNVSTGDDGAFELGPLPPEETFNIKVVQQAHRTLELKSVTAGSVPRELTMDPGETVSGSVHDDEGSPIPNANVSISAAGKGRSVPAKWGRTEENGTFTVGGLEPGRYFVVVTWTPEQHVTGEPIEVEAGGEPVKITLAAGKRIKGTLKVDDIDKLGQVRVMVVDKDGNTKGTAWIWGPRGLEFNIGALKAGRYTVKVVRGWPPKEEVIAELADVEAGDESVEVVVGG